jgi:hypothetical protein
MSVQVDTNPAAPTPKESSSTIHLVGGEMGRGGKLLVHYMLDCWMAFCAFDEDRSIGALRSFYPEVSTSILEG